MTNALLQVSGYPNAGPSVPWIDVVAVVVGVVLLLGSSGMVGLLYLRRNRDR